MVEKFLGSKVLLSILLVSLLVSLLSSVCLANGNANENNASINLYGEKTDVYIGEDILLKLSVVNYISNPIMNLQVIIIPPSGMSVTSSEFSKTAAGQFSSNYELSPGAGRDIEISMRSNEVGEFNVKGKIIYYFGDQNKSQYYETELPITVRRSTVLTDTKNNPQNEAKKGTIGFEIILLGVAMISVLIIVSVIIIYLLKR